jgi:hypothetical protein
MKPVRLSHNEEPHNLYSSPSIIRVIKSRRMRWAGHVARMGEKRNACRILVGKSDGKGPLARPRRRWVDNIKMDLRERGGDRVDWIHMPQDGNQWRALVNTAFLYLLGRYRRLSTKLLPNFVDSGCRVVSATDPHGR